MSTIDFINQHVSPMEMQALNAGLSQHDAQLLQDEHMGRITPQEMAQKINPMVLKYLADKQKSLSIGDKPSVLQTLGANHPILGHAAGELGTAGKDIENSLSTILGKAGINIPKDPTDYYKAYGVNENLADKVISPLLGFTAGGAAGEASAGRALENFGENLAPKVAENAKSLAGLLTGGALTNPDHPLNGALSSADVGAPLKSAIDAAQPALSEGVKKFAGQYGQNEMARRVVGSLKSRLQDTGQSIADFLKSGYDEHMGKFNNAMDTAKDLAKNIKLDNFDDSPYRNILQSHIDDTAKLTPIEQEAKQDSVDFAKDQLNKGLVPTNLNDLLVKNKTLNQDADKFYKGKYQMADGADYETNQLVKRLKQGIQDTFDKNINNAKADYLPKDVLPSNEGNVDKIATSKSSNIQNLKDAFNSANEHYGFAQSLAELPDQYGNPVEDKGLLTFLKSGKDVDDKTINKLNNVYLKSGLNDLNHLSSQIGDEQAKQGLANSLYNKAAGDNGIDMVSMVNAYNKMSPEVQSQVLTPNEKSMLDALSETKANSRTVAHVPYSRQNPISYMLPALAGAGGYGAHGLAGAATGALGAMVAEKAAGKALSNPDTVRALFEANQIPGLNTLSNAISKTGGYAGSQTVPQLINLLNGDNNNGG